MSQEIKLSEYQNNIVNFVANGSGSAFISASAGSAKTFTLIESSKQVPPHMQTLMVAFNKHIATELQTKVNRPNITVKTLNSLGFNAWRKFTGIYKRDFLNANKTEELIHDATSYENTNLIMKFQYVIKQLVSKAKHNGLVPSIAEFKNLKKLTEDTTDNWKHLIKFYGLEEKIKSYAIQEVTKKVAKQGKLTDKEAQLLLSKHEKEIEEVENKVKEAIISLSRDILIKSIKLRKISIDFDDQIYLPIIYKAKIGSYDFIYVDELQDLSMLNVELLKLCASDNCRVLGFGDARQRIYTWRGADQSSIDNFITHFNCQKLPLTICYRCSKSIIKEAQVVNSEIEAWEEAPEGHVEHIEDLLEEGYDLSDQDMIICRFNAPLVNLAIRMINKGIPLQFVGKDIQAQLKNLVAQFTVAPEINIVLEVRDTLDLWFNSQIGKLVNKYGSKEDIPGEEENPIKDMFYCLFNILKSLDHKDPIRAIYDKIDSIFMSNKGVKVSSVHRSKGLEAHRVFFLDRDKLPSDNIRNEWQKVEENNIIYVGITRAKHTLYYAQSDADFRKAYYKENKNRSQGTRSFNMPSNSEEFMEKVIPPVEEDSLLPEPGKVDLHDHVDYGLELDDLIGGIHDRD